MYTFSGGRMVDSARIFGVTDKQLESVVNIK
jgi:hypothetical protein